MLSLLKKLFATEKVNLEAILKAGAVVVDVRSRSEFAMGHVKGSINIPLEQVEANAEKLKKHAHVIVCCRSGNRSGQAQRVLKAKGLSNVTNGGSWQNVNQYL